MQNNSLLDDEDSSSTNGFLLIHENKYLKILIGLITVVLLFQIAFVGVVVPTAIEVKKLIDASGEALKEYHEVLNDFREFKNLVSDEVLPTIKSLKEDAGDLNRAVTVLVGLEDSLKNIQDAVQSMVVMEEAMKDDIPEIIKAIDAINNMNNMLGTVNKCIGRFC